MILIDEVTEIPQLLWTEHSSLEFSTANVMSIQEASQLIWLIKAETVLAVAGLIYGSFSSPPWLWFLTTQELKALHVRQLQPLVKKLAPGTLTAVKNDFTMGHKFAKLFEFAPTELVEQDYRIYRKI